MSGIKMRSGDWVRLLVLSVLWGGSFFFIAVAVKAVPPLTLVTLRVSLAAVTLYVLLRILGQNLPSDRKIWRAFFGMAVLNNVVPFCLLVWGQTHIASGLASILNATTPIWTVIVAHFLTHDEKMTGPKILGIIFGFVGVITLIGSSVFKNFGVGSLAEIACLAATLSYALAGIYGRRFKAMNVSAPVTATGSLTAAALVLMPISLFIDRPWHLAMPGANIWLAILGLAVLSTALAYLLYFRLLADVGATNLLIVTFLIPVTAILLGALVLGERLQFNQFVGMGCIALGLVALDGRIFRIIKSV